MQLVINLPCSYSKIIASAILLFRNATQYRKSVSELDNCQLPQGWGQEAMSNPHLGCGDARGWGGWGMKLTSALRLNPLKCEALNITSKRCPLHFNYYIGSHLISWVQKVK